MVRKKYGKDHLKLTEELIVHNFHMCEVIWLLGIDHVNSVENNRKQVRLADS